MLANASINLWNELSLMTSQKMEDQVIFGEPQTNIVKDKQMDTDRLGRHKTLLISLCLTANHIMSKINGTWEQLF